MAIQINLQLAEIYKVVCPKCQKKIRDLVKDKMADDMIKSALEDTTKEGDA